MKLDMIKGFAVLRAENKKETEKMMMFYLGKNPAPQVVISGIPREQAPRKYTHSPEFIKSRAIKGAWNKKPKERCEYGCGEFKHLSAHLHQKHGQGKDGKPKIPNLKLRKRTGTSEGTQSAKREYLDISHIGAGAGNKND